MALSAESQPRAAVYLLFSMRSRAFLQLHFHVYSGVYADVQSNVPILELGRPLSRWDTKL
jgi:hypothetical protein